MSRTLGGTSGRTWFGAALALLVVAASAAAQSGPAANTTVVNLKPAASIASAEHARDHDADDGNLSARPLLLGDVADVHGANAESLRMLRIAEDATKLPGVPGVEGVVVVGLPQVRAVLDRAGVHWGRTVLSGSTCEVRLDWPSLDGSKRTTRAERPEPETVDVRGEPTIRKAVALRLASHLGVQPSELKLLLRAPDTAALDRPTGSWRVDVEVGAVSSSARAPVRIFAYEGDRVAMSATIDAEILVEREVLVAARDVPRGETLGPTHLRAERRWLTPAAAGQALATLSDGVPPLASTRIREGTVLTGELLQAPIAAKRGDTVWVHCLSGAVRIKARARAMETVRDGEVGLFRLEGSQETFRARMSGAGRAVMIVGRDESTTHQHEAATARSGDPR